MQKKTFIFLPVIALLAACGNAPASSSSPSASGLSVSSQPSASGLSSQASQSGLSSVPTEKVTVTFWTPFGQKNGEALEEKAAQFSRLVKQNEGVDVEIVHVYKGGYDDIAYNITNGFSAGNVPTMAIAYPDHVADYLSAGEDYVYDLTSYFSDASIGFGKQSYLDDTEGVDDFVEAFMDEGTHYVKEGIYSMPFMKSSEVMFYNVGAAERAMAYYDPAIAAAGKTKEKIASMSWDELIALSRVAVEHKAEVLQSLKTPIWYDSDSNLFISKMYQNEIPYSSIAASGKGSIDFANGEARTQAEAMVTALREAHDDGLLITKGSGENLYGSDAFKNQECIFEIGSSGGTGYNDPEGSAFTVGVAKVPASHENPLYVSQGPTMTFLKNPKLSKVENDLRMRYAWQFAKYITNAPSNVYLCIYGSEGYLPVRYSAYDTPEFAEFLEEGEIYADSARVLINDIDGRYFNSPVFKGSAELRDQVGGVITEALSTSQNISDLFDKAITNARKKF